MTNPPSYEESTSQYSESAKGCNGDSKPDLSSAQRFCIREGIGISRAQHVAALISKLLGQIRERAQQGLSKSTLLLLPFDQAECSYKGQLVGYSGEEPPILIQLEGRYDGTEFWTQQEALDLLEEQMLAALWTGESPKEEPVSNLPERPQAQKKSSLFGWKASKPAVLKPVTPPVEPPVSVDVHLEQVNFRSETDFGLYETLTGRAVAISIQVR